MNEKHLQWCESNAKRCGRNYKRRCLFHEEKTPSMIINPRSGLFHCYGCATTGTIDKLIEKAGTSV